MGTGHVAGIRRALVQDQGGKEAIARDGPGGSSRRAPVATSGSGWALRLVPAPPPRPAWYFAEATSCDTGPNLCWVLWLQPGSTGHRGTQPTFVVQTGRTSAWNTGGKFRLSCHSPSSTFLTARCGLARKPWPMGMEWKECVPLGWCLAKCGCALPENFAALAL